MKKRLLTAILVLAATVASAAGVETLSIDQQAYVDYLKRITHSKTLTLKHFADNSDEIAAMMGQRVTVMGFARPLDGSSFFTRAFLAESNPIRGEADNKGLSLQFTTETPVYFKPFEVYQITGVLEKGGEGEAGFVIRAKFAEPQGSLSKIMYSPDLSAEAASLPALVWDAIDLPRNDLGELIESDPQKIVVPEALKKLAGQTVRFETWLVDHIEANFAPPATGSAYVSPFVISSGICKCCGIKAKYDMGNVGMLVAAPTLPAAVRGGVFMGKVQLNEVAKYETEGLFTVVDAVLVKPFNLPDAAPPVLDAPPKVEKKDLLPAIFLPKKQ